MAILCCTTKYLILPGETEVIWAPGKVGISLGKVVPNSSQTVCIEKLTESVSVTGFSLSGMVGVSGIFSTG